MRVALELLHSERGRLAAVEADRLKLGKRRGKLGDSGCGKMDRIPHLLGVSNVPLDPAHAQPARQRSPAAHLDRVAEALR